MSAIDIHAPTENDGVSALEHELHALITEHRASLGLGEIPLSESLTLVAGRHAEDTTHNILLGPGLMPGTDLRSWSDAPYHVDDRDPTVMWDAPERLGTPYAGPGFEGMAISYGPLGPTPGFTATPDEVLTAFLASPAHAAMIEETGPWADFGFGAMGVGIATDPRAGQVVHVWFGGEADPLGAPSLTAGQAREVAYLYEVALDREPDLAGLNYWIGERALGMTIEDLSNVFLASDEFAAAFGPAQAMTDVEFVETLYLNVLDRPGEAPGIAHWARALDDGLTRAELLVAFASSPENAATSAYIETLNEISDGDWAFV